MPLAHVAQPTNERSHRAVIPAGKSRTIRTLSNVHESKGTIPMALMPRNSSTEIVKRRTNGPIFVSISGSGIGNFPGVSSRLLAPSFCFWMVHQHQQHARRGRERGRGREGDGGGQEEGGRQKVEGEKGGERRQRSQESLTI